MNAALKPLALYVHVPFCKAKCTYCDFYSVVGREAEIPYFQQMLLEEIRNTRQHLNLSGYFIDTVFFGGGTPNLLMPHVLEQILNSLLKLTKTGADMEIGMEINPGEADLERLKAYRGLGINRISIGMQSFQPELLRFMSRIHTADKSRQTFSDVRTAGFENVSADLIFAIPGQSRQQWAADLGELVGLQPEHISTYSLTVEEGTALHRWVTAGEVNLQADTVDTGMYGWGRNFLNAAGYDTYEISNHARPGYACRHNLNYWMGIPYLGFGPAAHSFFAQRRHWNTRDLDQYLKQIATLGSSEAGHELIDATMARNELILTRLRLSQGLDLSEYHRCFKEDLLTRKQDVLEKWSGYLQVKAGYLTIKAAGWALVDEISSDLMFVAE